MFLDSQENSWNAGESKNIRLKLYACHCLGGWVVQGSQVGAHVLGGYSLLPVGARKSSCCSILLVGIDKTEGVDASFQLELENWGVVESFHLELKKLGIWSLP